MRKVKGGIAAGLQLGSLGFKVRGLTVEQVLADSEYFAEILARNKMIGFIGLNPTDEEHMQLLHALYTGDDPAPTGGLIHEQCHSGKDNTETESLANFVGQMWHVDNPFYENVPSYTSMHMVKFDCEPDVGNTVLASLTSMYEKCPEHFKTRLESARFIHGTGSVARVMEDMPTLTHSALRTHPVTGETMLYWTGNDTELENDEPWFNEFRKWVTGFLADKSNWYRWQWHEGDFIIWDNRALIHSVSPGWKHEERVFTRGETGLEAPFYNRETPSRLNPEFGDIYRKEGISRDTSTGPNPDHIPLVFTKGIYALPEYQHLYQCVTMFVLSSDGEIPPDVAKLKEIIDDADFHVVAVVPTDDDFLSRFSRKLMVGHPREGQKFLFTRNGSLEKPYCPTDDLFTDELDDFGRWPPVPLIKALLEFHPDMRHAGHAWHYPDWFPHQQLQNRPWDWKNLSFINYAGFPNSEPPIDFLVQFAIDTVYGCFNHLKTNEERRHVIEEIIDYMQFMLQLGEHEADR
jgi:alpha-ketoglutarate-dependent taurine dioxygenase